MGILINIIAVGIAALFLSIPVLNKNVFHTVNIDKVIAEGKDGISAIQDRFGKSEYDSSRARADYLIDLFRSDSIVFFTPDIIQWDSVYALYNKPESDFGATILKLRLNDEDIDTMKVRCEAMALQSSPSKSDSIRVTKKKIPPSSIFALKIVKVLNVLKDNLGFYVENAERLEISKHKDLRAKLDDLLAKGILIKLSDSYTIKKNMTVVELVALKKFHGLILEKVVFPRWLYKDLLRNRDWASEYIVQTAMYFVGASYYAQQDYEKAIEQYDLLIEQYPKTIYAENLFLQIGRLLTTQGTESISKGKNTEAMELLHRAIRYLEKIERNREIARDFPKYRNTELNPGVYVNIDEASKAKRNLKEKSKIYTLAQEKAELALEGKNVESGSTLEDAIKQIGQCYILLGSPDSARMQFSLLGQFFPESDNLAEAQKLIADSYVKEGDLVFETKDSSSESKKIAFNAYEKAVKEYLKFVNIFSQTKLISDVYIALGDVYNKLGKPAEGTKAFAAALDLSKEIEKKANVQLKIGTYYFEKKRFGEAIKAYQVILNTFMSTEVAANAQYLLGDCYISLSDTTKAIEAYKSVVANFKKSSYFAGSAKKVADWNFARKNYKEALHYYLNGYVYDQNGPLAAQCLLQAGLVWVAMAQESTGEDQKQNYAEAIKQFNKIIENPEFVNMRESDQARYQLTECYVLLGNPDAAKKASKDIKSRDIIIASIKLIGVDVDNPEKELEYWEGLYKDAVEDEERASVLYDKAMILLDKLKRLDEAMAVFRQIIGYTKDETKNLNARIGISRTFIAQKSYADAETTIVNILKNTKLQPELAKQLQVQLYDVYFKSKEFDKSYEGFDKFVTLNPQHVLAPYAQYRVGLIFAEQKENQKSIDAMKVILSTYATSDYFDKASLSIGDQLIAMGKPSEGVDYLEKYLKKHPLDSIPSAPNFYMKIAEGYYKGLNNKEKAAAAYKALLDTFPDDPLFSYASYQLGSIYKDEGKDKEAISTYARVLKKDGQIYRASQAEIGKILSKTDPEAAIKNYQEIVAQSETAEDSAIALIGIGDVYVGMQKWELAAATFENVYTFYKGKEKSMLVGALVKWTDALNNAKKYKEAIAAAQIMQQMFPDSAYTENTMYFEAAAYMALKNYADSRKAFQKLVASGKNPVLLEIAYLQKADCLFFGQKKAEAIREYDEYLKKYPEGKYNAQALFMQGNIYWADDNFALAAKKFGDVVTKYPTFADVCSAKNYYAFSLNKIDKWKDALKVYGDVIKGNCGADPVKFAREHAESIKTAH